MNKKEQYVEDLGVQFEKMGRTPIEGRVFSCLLVANPPEISFDEIVDFLQASKSSVSNALKKLQQECTVKYITKSGDRKRYFVVDVMNWKSHLKQSSQHFKDFNSVLEGIVEYRSTMESETFNKEMKDALEFHHFISKRFEEAIAEWEAR